MGRAIAALFLKETLSVAANDSERRAMEKAKQKHAFAHSLKDIFARADTSGDGKLSRSEFKAMMQDDAIVEIFDRLDLDHDEVSALFEILSSDDGYADYEEFLLGALKMKSSARTFDAIQI